MIRRYVSYPRFARSVSADLYHLVDQSYSHLLRVLPAERSLVTCHDLTPFRIAADKLPVAQRRHVFHRYRLSVEPMRRAARIACVSETTRHDVIRFLGLTPERLTVIRQGVDRRFHPLDTSEIGRIRTELNLKGPVILHVDSGLPYKNVDGVLRVVEYLHRQGIEASLLRVGRRLQPANQRLADELRISRAIFEQGRVGDDRLVELYNAADVLLFPSYHEGFGFPPLEAMACGTPVVVSNCDALVETVANAGLTAPPGDIGALATAVARVLSDPETAKRLSAAGRSRAEDFDWEQCAIEYVHLYREITEQSLGQQRQRR
jgi:glycosyltransferase involved in cell wall biosynthesis